MEFRVIFFNIFHKLAKKGRKNSFIMSNVEYYDIKYAAERPKINSKIINDPFQSITHSAPHFVTTLMRMKQKKT